MDGRPQRIYNLQLLFQPIRRCQIILWVTEAAQAQSVFV